MLKLRDVWNVSRRSLWGTGLKKTRRIALYRSRIVWLPLVSSYSPSPIAASKGKVARCYTGALTSSPARAMAACDASAPFVMHCVKLYTDTDGQSFSAFGRIYSGIVKPGDRVKVLGEAGQEARDKNMPRNLHNAAELFLRCGMVDQAEKLQTTTSDMLDIYATKPDGSSHSMGRAAVCWECGFCGLPREAGAAAPACGACGAGDANWLRVTREKGGEDVPWIQKKALSPEEKRRKDEAARAAKRAEVEANVRAAMAARKAAAAS